MNAQNTYPNQEPEIHNPLSTMQPGERNICEVKRHPFGMAGMYIASGALLVVLAAVAFLIVPHAVTTANRGQLLAIGTLGFVVIALLTLAFVFISHVVYWGNRWILTTDSLTQITQTSLFGKHNSQLSLGNLEDVSADQNGILAHMFNFGTLRAETAGERSKFVLTFCPRPNFYAQQILQARENFEQGRRAASFGNQDLNHYSTPMGQQPPQSGTASYQVPVDDDISK